MSYKKLQQKSKRTFNLGKILSTLLFFPTLAVSIACFIYRLCFLPQLVYAKNTAVSGYFNHTQVELAIFNPAVILPGEKLRIQPSAVVSPSISQSAIVWVRVCTRGLQASKLFYTEDFAWRDMFIFNMASSKCVLCVDKVANG